MDVGSVVARRLWVLILAVTLLAWHDVRPAQAQGRGGDAPDRPLIKTRPRAEIYPDLAQELDLSADAAKALVQPLEDRGYNFRDAIALVLVAKLRAERLIREQKKSRDGLEQETRTSAEFLADLAEREKLGWRGLTREAGVDLEPRLVTAKAMMLITGVRLRVGSADGAGGETASGPAVAARPGQETGPAARQATPGGTRRSVRQRDAQPERTAAKAAIEKNLAQELGVDQEVAKSYLTRIADEVPLREAIMLMLVANLHVESKIMRGEVLKEKKKAALDASMDQVLERVENDEGWGTIGRAMGVEVSGRELNQKANAILGQQ